LLQYLLCVYLSSSCICLSFNKSFDTINTNKKFNNDTTGSAVIGFQDQVKIGLKKSSKELYPISQNILMKFAVPDASV